MATTLEDVIASRDDAASIDPLKRAIDRYERGELGTKTGQPDKVVPVLKPVPDSAVEVLEPVAQANLRTSANLEFTDADADVAQALNISLDGTMDALVSRAVTAINQAALRAVEAGYLLLKVKSSTERGQFGELIESAGLSVYRAAEMMRMAKVLTLAPAAQRAAMLEMPKHKVLALASADPVVLEALMEDGADKIDALSVRELKAEIKSMKKALVDAQVQRDTAEAELKTTRQKLHGREQRTDGVPNVVADMRQEIGALVREIEVRLQSMGEMARGLKHMKQGASAAVEWVDGTARQAIAGLSSVMYQADAVVHILQLGVVEGDVLELPTVSQLSEDERDELHMKWRAITQIHEYEKSLRAYERAQARPKGPGRPLSKPVPPADID